MALHLFERTNSSRYLFAVIHSNKDIFPLSLQSITIHHWKSCNLLNFHTIPLAQVCKTYNICIGLFLSSQGNGLFPSFVSSCIARISIKIDTFYIVGLTYEENQWFWTTYSININGFSCGKHKRTICFLVSLIRSEWIGWKTRVSSLEKV